MTLSDDTRVQARPDALSRVLDGEAVILDLASGTYYGLNETGSEVWTLIAEGATIGQLSAHLVEVFDADVSTVRADLVQLIDELHRRGLVDVTS